MKYLTLFTFSLVLITNYGQSHKVDEETIEMLKQKIATAKHDSVIVSAYEKWSFIINGEDVSFDEHINQKIIGICEKNLNNKITIIENLFFKKKMAFAFSELGFFTFRKGQFNKAQQYYYNSVKLYNDLNDYKGISIVLNRLGILFEEIGNTKETFFYHSKSLKISRLLGYRKGIAKNLVNIGALYLEIGDIKTALITFSESLKIFEELNDNLSMAAVLNNIGISYYQQGYFKKALLYYHKAVEIYTNTNNNDTKASMLNNIGIIHKEMGNKEKALTYFFKSLKIFKEIDNKQGIATALDNIGENYQEKGAIEKALTYHTKSLAIRETSKSNHAIILSLTNIGKAYFIKNELLKSKSFAERSLKLAKKIGYPNEIGEAALLLSKILEKQNKGKQALAMYKLYVNMHDSIINEAHQKQIIQLEKEHTIKKKDRELVLLSKQKELKSTQLKLSWILYSFLIVLLLSIIVIWYKAKKNKYEKELNELRELKDDFEIKQKKKTIANIPVNIKNKISTIDLEQVIFFHSRDKYVFLHLKENESYITNYTLKKLEEYLPDYFLRVHNSYIINKNEVELVRKFYRKKVLFTMKDKPKTEIPSSLGYSDNIVKLLNEINSLS